MAKGINKVILVGNLGADPDVRYTAAGARSAEGTLKAPALRAVGCNAPLEPER